MHETVSAGVMWSPSNRVATARTLVVWVRYNACSVQQVLVSGLEHSSMWDSVSVRKHVCEIVRFNEVKKEEKQMWVCSLSTSNVAL